MVLAYAGRRIDPSDAASTQRFPAQSVTGVAQEIDRVLRQQLPSIVVGSAACGSDLLVLEVAGRMRMRRRVILPFDRRTFRAMSVADRPGNWGSLFDLVIEDVAATGDLVELALDPKDARAYAKANAEIFDQTESLARVTDELCGALVLWNGVTRGGGDATEAFLKEARRRGWPVTEISTVFP